LYQGRTLGEIGGSDTDMAARKIKLDLGNTGHSQRIGNFSMPACDTPIFLDAEQNMGRLAPVSNETGTFRSNLLCAASILIELSAG
jgi:hypothetical protein